MTVKIDRSALVEKMTGLLEEVIQENRRYDSGGAAVAGLAEDVPLIGANAVVSSVSLVSFITDVEMMLSEDWELEVTLVSEEALSRKRSPFRNVGALADLILELAEAKAP